MNDFKLSTFTIEEGSRIIFPEVHLKAIYAHCRRKLSEDYLEDESRERKAFGLLAASKKGRNFIIEKYLPFKKNARQAKPYRDFMDEAMTHHAVPSKTPFSKRGWIADPEELMVYLKEIKKENLLLFGSYHMHRVAWPDDPLRDKPTALDTFLAAESGIFAFIISMVTPDRPLIRAFFEGRLDKEVPIIVSNILEK